MNILLIDKRVSQYEDIVAAIDPVLAIGVVFDYYADTFETIKTRISEALGSRDGASQAQMVARNPRGPPHCGFGRSAEGRRSG